MKQRLARAAEHIDERGHDEALLAQSLEQIADVNRYLGGTRAAIRAVESMLPDAGPVEVLDVGCGAGDIDAAFMTRMRRQGRDARLTALDLHPQILSHARQRVGAADGVTFMRADATSLPFADGSFDVAMMSLTLHHFDDDEPVRVLRELGRVARAVVINDLERNWQNHAGAQLLAHTLWARNRLTRHDGPLSVLRSFTAAELATIAHSAGLQAVRVRRFFFYRLVMTARSDTPAARSTVA